MTWRRRLGVGVLVVVTAATPIACSDATAGPPEPSATDTPTTGPTTTTTGPSVAVPDVSSLPDETASLQAELDALAPGATYTIPRGPHRHSEVLTVRVPGVKIFGFGATLIADDEERSALHLAADKVVVTGLTLTVASISKRWEAAEQHKIHISGKDGVELHSVRVANSAASGIFVDSGAGGFLLDSVSVSDTMADGIHLTGAAHNGRVVNPTVRRSGDDGVAVVSYGTDPGPTHDIVVESPWVHANKGGRGISVVGGENITYRDVWVMGSDSAAVYIAVEGDPFNTRTTRNVTVSGVRLAESNRNTEVDHGAVLVYSGREGETVSGVRVEDVLISGTRGDASRQVGILADDDAAIKDVTLAGFAIRGQPSPFHSNVDPASYRIERWVVDGVPYPRN